MTDFPHHTPKLPTEADAAADLAGVPRPAATPNDLPSVGTEECDHGMPTDLYCDACTIDKLVSERDELASRVRELEEKRAAAVNCLKWLKAHLGRFDPPASPNYLVGQIDAALTTPESKP